MGKQEQQAVRDFIRQAREGAVCQQCGATGEIDFHHPDPSAKLFTISEAPGRGYSLEQVQAELAKCVPLCDSCHGRISGLQGQPERQAVRERQNAAYKAQRRRLEIPEELYDELDRQARWLHISVTTLANMLLAEGLAAGKRRFSPSPAQLIAAEGSPSPTLAALQRKALNHDAE